MKAAIYYVSTGEIVRFVDCTPDHIAIQCMEGEEFYLNCPDRSTHIVNDQPVTIIPPPPTRDERLAEIRQIRNAMLLSSDWTQLPTARLTAERLAEWNAHRDALFDFPETCDPENPVWPEPPKPSSQPDNCELQGVQ